MAVVTFAAALTAVVGGPTVHAHADATAIYAEHCAPCHGPDGRGDGPGAYLLFTPPRSFRRAQYRLVSTWERTPTDDDLFAAITRGLPGTPMPSWSALPEADRRALVPLLEAFADHPWTPAPSRAPAPDGTGGTGVIVVPPEPADAHTNHARAYALFRDACAPCHGATGHGDGRDDLVDDDGHPVRPSDLTLGVFKGDRSPEGLYRRIVAGMPGTAMPANAWAYGDGAWYLVRYVLALSTAAARGR